MIPWLFDLGVDEVVVMEKEEAGFMPGMLWRYLPVGEKKYDWVVCTGVDCLGDLGRELRVPQHHSSASLHPARFWMPFAGPFAIRPEYLSEIAGPDLDAAAALSGYAELWQSPDLDSYEGQILDRCRRGDRARYCDAAFLSLCFWNPALSEGLHRACSCSMYRNFRKSVSRRSV